MKRHAITLAILCAMVVNAFAQRGLDDPLTQAMMQAYQSLLDEDPRDCETLFRRASEYYKHNEYTRALDDVNEALRTMPADDEDLRFQAYSLRANIYMQTQRYVQALADLNSVLAINPADYVAIYQRGTALYELGRYDEAKDDFALLRRINPRSQESLYGLARIAVKQNNIGTANELLDQAVAMTPSLGEAYVRRASVRTMMGDTPAAVDDYITAIGIDAANTPKALRELISLSRSDYQVVISGLNSAIRQEPRNGLFYYLRAFIAQNHCHYRAAIADYDKIINDRLDSFAGINASLAECYYALDDTESALLNIDYAIGAAPDKVRYHVLKSDIQLARGNADDALQSAEKALELNPDFNAALIAKAKALIAKQEYADASVALSEAAMNEPENHMVFMLRGWVLNDFRHQPDNARNAYERVVEMDFPRDDINSLRGFALLYLDREIEGDEWLENILETVPDRDGLINYYAACYWSARGNTRRALSCMETSLEKGYANRYNWVHNTSARINVAPLRTDPAFKRLLDKYASIFQ